MSGSHICFALALAFFSLPLMAVAMLPHAEPVEVGMDAQKLAKVDEAVNQLLEEEKIAGIVAVVARHGKIVHFKSYGYSNIEKHTPMENDAIFSIYSMTKSVVTVAAMQLYEQGKFRLDDPVENFLPQFKGLKVYLGNHETFEPKKLVDPACPLTIRHLMCHSAGFVNERVSVFDERYPLYRSYATPDKTLTESVERLAQVPLIAQPGEEFLYGPSTDVLARLVEVIAGEPLDVYLKQEVLDPLEMVDTDYYVPSEKHERLAARHTHQNGKLHLAYDPADDPILTEPIRKGGVMGLASTAQDYIQFCQMLLNGGTYNGKQILKKETVAEMTRNALPPTATVRHGNHSKGLGFGLSFAVRIERADDIPSSPVGEYGWGGAACTHFWISPPDDLAVVIMRQHSPNEGLMETQLKPLIYEAIIDR